MSETMWTGGEWAPYWRLNEAGNEADCGVVSNNGWAVCRCPRYQTREQWEADGSLLASAKELYEALDEAIRSHFSTWMAARAEVEGTRMSAQLFDMEPDVIRARAVLAKANRRTDK